MTFSSEEEEDEEGEGKPQCLADLGVCFCCSEKSGLNFEAFFDFE